MDPRERAKTSWERWDDEELERELAPWPVDDPLLYLFAWTTGYVGHGFLQQELPQRDFRVSHWSTGLCAPMALALLDLYPQTKLVAVADTVAHHYLVVFGKDWVDGFGAWTAARLLAYWRLRLPGFDLQLREATRQEVETAARERLGDDWQGFVNRLAASLRDFRQQSEETLEEDDD